MIRTGAQRFPPMFIWRVPPGRSPCRQAAGEPAFLPTPLGIPLRAAAWAEAQAETQPFIKEVRRPLFVKMDQTGEPHRRKITRAG